MKAFLGVDGGGTKTGFLIVDESGRVLAELRSGSAYYPETGVNALEQMLVEGIHGALQQAALAPAQLEFAFFGLPAHGEDSRLLARLDAIAARALPAQRYRCGNDMICGWAGALAGRDGINIVAGTGSIAYGEYESRSARGGGWGELFSDEGSAHWFAREALTLFSRMSDGRADKSALYALVRTHFKLDSDLDVCGAIYGPPALARSELAALAPLVSRAARAGDAQAQAIFDAAGDELAAIVSAVRGALAVPAHVSLPVSWSGGMFSGDSLLLPAFKAALQKREGKYEFCVPRLSPAAGAALYAAKLAGAPLAPAAIALLAQTHGTEPTEALV